MQRGEYTPLPNAPQGGPQDDGDLSSEHGEQQQIRDVVLRRVPDSLPISVWLVTAIEMCDKFAFFGLAGPLQNYLQNSRDDPLRPGVIGLGQAYATAVNQAFSLWCFLTPVLGAVVADQRLGRLKTILYASTVYMAGLLVVLVTSFPVFSHSVALIGLLVAMFLIGIGTGGIRPNVNSLVAEQYTGTDDYTRTLSSGELVIVDLKLTIQRIFLTFLFFVNMGSLSAIATTSLEHRSGFSVAFAMPTLAFAIGSCIVYLTRKIYKVTPPKGSVIVHAMGVLWVVSKNGWDFESAKSSIEGPIVHGRAFEWENDFVDEVRQAVGASRLFVYFPIFWTAYSQILTNFVSQAATMETHGIPNDILTMIDPLAIMFFIPILDRIVFPWIRRYGIPVSVTARITCGFILCSGAMAYTALVQKVIYSSPPCYSFPCALDCMDGRVPNEVHVLVQIPGYVLLALSEILISITGLEHAYTHAPRSMRSFVMSLFISTYAVGSLLALAITPFTFDPNIANVYSFLSLITFIVGLLFWFKNRHFEVAMHGPSPIQ